MNRTGILLFFVVLVVNACQWPGDEENGVILETIAQSDKQWTGVAVSHSSRVFVNYPYWSSTVPVSVAEIVNGIPKAFPNMEWNQRKDTLSFNAVQSVYVDAKDRLWILDTNNPLFKGVKSGGPYLYQFDLEINKMILSYTFPNSCFKSNSYFNDVRVDTHNEVAYITDSGDGAIIVLDLTSKKARRLLDDHPSTESETDHLICDSVKWENTVHSDGIALSPKCDYLYYIALTGHTLYRIPTHALRNENLSKEELEAKVEKVRQIPATDGMLFDDLGNLYLGGLEDNSINRLNADGELEKVIIDYRIKWADSFAKDTLGNIYFTTSQIHLSPENRDKFKVYMIKP